MVHEGEMRPLAYRLMHSRARLSAEERARLVRGLATTLGSEHARQGTIDDYTR